MRIVHTCLRYPPALGGVETYVREMANRTRDVARHIDVRVLTSPLRTHGPTSELSPDLLLDDPPYVQRLHYSSTPLISYPRLQALNYYLTHHHPDIVHGYSFWYQPADVAARWARQHHCPFIFHPMYYDSAVRRKWFWRLYKKTVGRTTFAAAAAVVVISPFEQTLIEQAGFPVKRFFLVPPGVDLADFTADHPNPFARYGQSQPSLLCVARLSADKGLQDVITVMPPVLHDHPQAHLFIVGEDFGYLSQLTKQVNSLGLSSHIHFLGALDRSHLLGAYQHADLFIHPSYYEAFGIVIAEAMAARTPVIARHTAAVPYVAPPDDCALLFQTQSQLYRHLSSILSNPSLKNQLVANAYHRVQSQFTWDLSIKKMTDLYAELVR